MYNQHIINDADCITLFSPLFFLRNTTVMKNSQQKTTLCSTIVSAPHWNCLLLLLSSLCHLFHYWVPLFIITLWTILCIQELLHALMPSMDRGLDPLFSIMCTVLAVKTISLIAHTPPHTTVPTVKMLESHVKVIHKIFTAWAETRFHTHFLLSLPRNGGARS